MRYVRVEFAGVEFSPDNELNGIAFQGVGRGGSYEYIQVHMNRDDALEWFGGTADIKYAVASNAADDSFDWTFGWTRPRAVRRHHPARRRRRQRHRGRQQRVQQQPAAALEPADLQHHDVRRPGSQRGRRGPARRELPSRHGVHVSATSWSPASRPPACRSRRHARPRAQVDNGTSQMGAGVAWGMPDATCTRASRPTSTAAASRTSGRATDAEVGISTDGLREPREPELPAVSVSRRWPVASSRRFSRPTTASSKPSPSSAPCRRRRPTTG